MKPRIISRAITAMLVLAPLFAGAQLSTDSTFTGYEEKCTTLPDGTRNCYTDGGPGTWYDLTHLTFRGDSVFVIQSMAHVVGSDTMQCLQSAGYSFWKGTVKRTGESIGIDLALIDCSGCPMNMQKNAQGKWDPIDFRKTYGGFVTATGLRLNGVLYVKTE